MTEEEAHDHVREQGRGAFVFREGFVTVQTGVNQVPGDVPVETKNADNVTWYHSKGHTIFLTAFRMHLPGMKHWYEDKFDMIQGLLAAWWSITYFNTSRPK